MLSDEIWEELGMIYRQIEGLFFATEAAENEIFEKE